MAADKSKGEMTPYYSDNSVQIFCGDALEALRDMPDESVQCVVTSPPYWGLRDYGTATWEGGDEKCGHIEKWAARRDSPGGFHNSTNDRSGARQPNTQATVLPYRETCAKCGARRIDSQLGLEKTPEEYVKKMVEVFREVRRVLRDDGTLWLNLGDSYARDGGAVAPGAVTAKAGNTLANVSTRGHERASSVGLKPKDLVGIPWRIAFALQADGWWLRSDIIWAKPNPMPESVTDRPTKSHEYLFLLAKSEKYYFDQDAVRDPYALASFDRWNQDIENQEGSYRVPGKTNGTMKAVGGHGFHGRQGGSDRVGPQSGGAGSEEYTPGKGRNIRTVWTIATQPYSEAHFATFPEALVKPCVLAGSRPSDTVLDPFAGSGTALYVAKELGRRAIGIELKADYIDLAAKRLAQEVLHFNDTEKS